jgi:glycerate kinase
VKPRRILIAPDKFKGTLTADQAARAIAAGWRKVHPRDAVTLAPISDGGDGFGAILGSTFGARARRVSTVNAAGEKIRATWWMEPDSGTAIIESANIIGLAMLPAGRFHPFQLDTTGLGQVLKAAAQAGARRCFVGIGGSATNDGGFGLARELGWRFLTGKGAEITSWTNLPDLREIRAPAKHRLFRQLNVAVDVSNPLLGKLGCSRIYGPQKGLQKADFAAAEKALSALAKARGEDFAKEPGAGAAGGLGFGLSAFANARLQPGFSLIAKALNLRTLIRRSDLVLTGEGMMDRSTAMGKGTGELATLCGELNRPCIGLGGRVEDRAALRGRFADCHAVVEIAGSEAAMARPAHWLASLAKSVAACS